MSNTDSKAVTRKIATMLLTQPPAAAIQGVTGGDMPDHIPLGVKKSVRDRNIALIEDLAKHRPPFIDITSHPAEVVYDQTADGPRRRPG